MKRLLLCFGLAAIVVALAYRVSPQSFWFLLSKQERVKRLYEENHYYYHEGRYGDCIRVLRQITRLKPDELDAYDSAAWLSFSLGVEAERAGYLDQARKYYSEAEECHLQAVTRNPNSEAAHFNYGNYAYSLRKDYVAALPILEKAIALGNRPDARKIHAHTLEKLGRTADAARAWDELGRDYPDDGVIALNRARAHARLEPSSASRGK